MSRSKSSKRARVLIVDDHPAVREALALWIRRQRDLEVCGEAADKHSDLGTRGAAVRAPSTATPPRSRSQR